MDKTKTKIRRTSTTPARYGLLEVRKDDVLEVPRGVAGTMVRDGGWEFATDHDPDDETSSDVETSGTPTSRRRSSAK